MSRRSVTTIHARVSLRVPQGSNVAEVLEYIASALSSHKGGSDPSLPISSIDTNSMIVKLEKKETSYL